MRDETRRKTETRLRRLREMLRAGDPAGDGESLPPERVREMRRRVLGGLPERRRPRLLWAAGAASAAMAVLALVVTLALHREVPPPGLPPEPPAPPPAALSPESPAPPVASPAPAAPAVAAERLAPRPRRSRSLAPAARRAAPAPAAPTTPEAAPAPQAAAPLQIQFNTPGGTRVIWVLDPPDPS